MCPQLDVWGRNPRWDRNFNETGNGMPLDGLVGWNGTSFVSMGSFSGYGYVPAMGVADGQLYIMDPDGLLFRYVSGGNWNYLQGSLGGSASTIGGYGGDVIVGGDIDFFGGQYVHNIFRYDGLTHELGAGQGLDDFAWRMINWDGKLVAGGLFQNAGGVVATSKVAAFDGTGWSSLGVGATIPFNGSIHSMVEYNGDLIVGGYFTSIAGVAANRVARYDGSSWYAMGTGSFGTVTELYVWNDELYGRVELTSGFPSISRWTGSVWEPVGDGLFGGDIYRMGDDNGDLIIAGQATSVEGLTINGIARYDGNSWSPLGAGVTGTLGPRIWGMLIQDGLIYIGGQFTSAGGTPANNLAVWDGSSWSEFGGGADSNVYDIRNFNGDIVVTGSFTTIGGVAASGMARWDGSTWHAMGSGINAHGRSLAEFDGRLYVGSCSRRPAVSRRPSSRAGHRGPSARLPKPASAWGPERHPTPSADPRRSFSN